MFYCMTLMDFGGGYDNVKYYYWIKWLEKCDEYKSFMRNKSIFLIMP